MFEFELPERFRRYVPPAVWLIVTLVLLLIPLKIISYGYLPGDDALRHAAKAVSGKPWPEILVVGDTFQIDHNLGWHGILGLVHRVTGSGAEGLVLVSVVALFLLVNLAALPWLKRPEAWLVVLLAAMVISDLPHRFMLGRPFVVTITVLLTVLFATQNRQPSRRMFALFAVLIAVCTFVHGVWYLWLLPIAAFVFAGQFRWSLLLAGAWVAGSIFSSLLCGHPVEYFSNALLMMSHGLGQHLTNRTEVSEFQPFGGDIVVVLMIGGLAALRAVLRPGASALAKSPAFWLMCGCWMLGFRVSRFWEDWGWPAVMVFIATEMDLLFVAQFAADSWRRLLLVAILAVAAFLSVTCDLNQRWTTNLTWQFLSVAEHPELEGWMPGKDGILYSPDMTVFYQTFFKNPNADWRYMVGYEPALMPAEDFKTYHGILWNFGDAKAYVPWVKKMKPADRMVLRAGKAERPNIPGLEWNYGVSGLWIGRVSGTNAPLPFKSQD